ERRVRPFPAAAISARAPGRSFPGARAFVRTRFSRGRHADRAEPGLGRTPARRRASQSRPPGEVEPSAREQDQRMMVDEGTGGKELNELNALDRAGARKDDW